MKRIILSVLAIAMAIGITTGAAFALFSPTATVSGVTFSTGNASLLVSGTDSGYTDNWGTILDFTNMYPSDTVFQTQNMYLRNASTSNIALNVFMKLASVDTWNTPEIDALEFQVIDTTDDYTDGWHTLRDWNTTGYPITKVGNAIANLTNRRFTVNSRLPATYHTTEDYMVSPKHVATSELVENEVSSKSVTNVNFTLTGTQN